MPALNTAPAANPTRQAVEAQFLSRPTLSSVTAQLLSSLLVEKYPPLALPVADFRLAVPREGGGRTLLPLLEVALNHLADGSFPDLTSRQGLDCYLSDATGNRFTYQLDEQRHNYSLDVIEDIIRELPGLLFISFQEALAAYWGQASGAGTSLWKWLSDVLQGLMLEAATRQANLTAEHLEILSILNRYPDRATRSRCTGPDKEVHAYTLETHLRRKGKLLTLQATEILVVRREQVALYRLPGEFEPYPDLDAFGQAWGKRLQERFSADRITWQQYEPDGNIFEVQAALILNQQLDDLRAIQLPAGSTAQALEQLFAVTTDPAQWLAGATITPLATLESIQAALPAHLKNTSTVNRLAYRQNLLEQASIKRQMLGDADFENLETLRSYASEHLNQQLCLERTVAQGGQRTCALEALSDGYQANDLELTFHVPVGSLEGGYIEPVTMSLVDLALKNLSGRPKGRMTLSHRTGREIEAWLTPEWILQLVQRVDIGKNYPAYLHRELLGNTEAARKRQHLFQQLRPTHLKSQALERLINGEAGLTLRGAGCVSALTNPNPLERRVDGDEIVIRTLAFVRKPGATADVVRNMFIIEPRDTQLGPHLLYRPSYPDALLEYPRRDLLLEAIVKPGAVQDSVLTWMEDAARPIYSNGGFTQPHYVRIGMGSEFDRLPSVPKPAELAKADDESNDEILHALTNGSLMDYLFGCETQQLLDQAERASTSNSESRWAVIMEGLQLGFNTLLLIARGPLAAIVWLIQAAQSLVKDLPALESDDPTAKELAWVDLLLNIGMLMLQQGSVSAPGEKPLRDEQVTTPSPFKHPLPGQRVSKLATVEQGRVGLPSEPPGGGQTLLDFDRSLAGDGATAGLFEKLRSFNVSWPTPTPQPLTRGYFRGLYSINNQWHASVGGLLFKVNVVPGFAEVYIVHPLKPLHPGIKLKTDGQGHWTLDRGLKLIGGGRKRVMEIREQKRLEAEAQRDRSRQIANELRFLMPSLDSAGAQLRPALEAMKKQLKTVQLIQELLLKASDTQRPALDARHQTEVPKFQRLRTQFLILLENLETQFAQSLPIRFELAALSRQLPPPRALEQPLISATTILRETWDQQLFIHQMQNEALILHTLTASGEPLPAWLRRVEPQIMAGDLTATDETIRSSTRFADYLEHMAVNSATMETTLQQLAQGSSADRVIRQQLLDAIPSVELFFSDNLKINALEILTDLSLLRLKHFTPGSTLELYYKTHYEVLGLDIALKSHIEVRSSTEYPLAEQRNVYETILKKYQRAEFSLRVLKSVNSSAIGPEAERVLAGLEYTKALARNELESVVRQQEDLKVELPPSKTLRAKPASKRVFKTRRKEYLIGEHKPADTQNAEEQISISDTLTGKTLASYNKQADGWEPIAEQSPTPPVLQDRSLPALKSEAKTLIEQRKDIEQLITTDRAKLDSHSTRQEADPSEWEELLSGHANKLTDLADEIKREHLGKPTAQDLIDECLAEARDINRWAQNICSDAYKRQWPTMEGVTYLWDHRQIDINLTSKADPQRPTLSGDFFTEYAVYDKAQKPPVVLWYAHFHYATADAAPNSYTRAHLKLPEQRKYTQKDLLKIHVQADLHARQEPGSEPLTRILYVLITPPTDNLFLGIAPASKTSIPTLPVESLQLAGNHSTHEHETTTPPRSPVLRASPTPRRLKRQSSPPSQPAAADSLEGRVAVHFASRPSLRSVVTELLAEAFKAQHPTLEIDIANTSLAVPSQAGTAQYVLTPLLDLALEHVASGAELDFSDRFGVPCKWIDTTHYRFISAKDDANQPALPLDMRSVELAIRSLRPNVKSAFAEALCTYWGQDAFPQTSNAGERSNHWSWLGDTLLNTLRIAGLQQPGLDDVQRQTLEQVTRYPDGAERAHALGILASEAWGVNSTLSKGNTTVQLLSPDLLITRDVDGRDVILHASAAGVVTPYSSLEAFAKAWELQLRDRFVYDRLDWQLVELNDPVFEIQAALLLNGQLQNLEAIQLPATSSIQELEQLFAQASATAPWFNGALSQPTVTLEAMARNMPAWLTHASAIERFAYQSHILTLASSVQRNNGRTFLTGIPDIRTYAEQQLDAQLKAKGYSAKDLEITFKVAVGTLSGGYIEPVKMSLIQMALENLSGLPKGEMDIHLRGQPVNDPTLAQYLKDLISDIDIGKHYPALLEQHLLGDTAQSQARQALFIEQVPIQLVMQASELKLKGQSGLTAQGVRFVETVTRPWAGNREVEGMDITVRPLAFLRKPGATPDVVENMFLIEPNDVEKGPHMLYRPQLSPPLREFASRAALLNAIQQPGALQQSILAWLPDANARAVYGNGGFRTPHIAHYGVFNEFDAPNTPGLTTLAVDGFTAATTLAQDLNRGDLMKHLFNANAHSLINLAKDQSTSDAESRWASHKELGWLLFNTLLPVLRGPGAMAGWLLQMSSVENDIQQASEPSNPDPSAAMVNLLVNVGTLLSHTTAGSGTLTAREVGKIPFADRSEVNVPLHRNADTHVSSRAVIRRAEVSQLLETAKGPFDFAFSSPHALTASQRAHLESFSVPAPTGHLTPAANGSLKGLYTINGKLCANIDNHWYRVARDLDGLFVIDDQDKARTGPPLKIDSKGNWQFDTGPKLKGGMPRSGSRIKAAVVRNAEAMQTMEENYNAAKVLAPHMAQAVFNANQQSANTEERVTQQVKKLKTVWSLVNSDHGTDFSARYQTEKKAYDDLLTLQSQHFSAFEKAANDYIDLLSNALKTITPDNPALDDSALKKMRSTDHSAIAELRRAIASSHNYNVDPFFGHAIGDEPLNTGHLIERLNRLTGLIDACEANNKALEAWKSDSPIGKKNAEAYIQTSAQRTTDKLLAAKLEYLLTLRALSIDRDQATSSLQEEFLITRFDQINCQSAANSHIELQVHEGYTADDGIAVLSGLIDKYKDELAVIDGLRDIDSKYLRADYAVRYTKTLTDFIAQVQAELADLVREQEGIAPLEVVRKNREHKSDRSKVFKTRDKQTLIGTLRIGQPDQEPSTSDVLNPQTGQAVTSYSWHATESEWVQIVQSEPVKPAPTPAVKSLATYTRNAKTLLDGQTEIESRIQFQKKKLDDPERRESVYPKDWSDMLETQAHSLDLVAQQAEANHGAKSETTSLLAQWRNAANDMRQRAIMHRCEGYLRQAPRPENVDYLWTHGRVDIGLVARGKPLKNKDFLSEYAVREKNSLNVLWYAHFHYPTRETLRPNYSAAHLKLPEQRYLTQKDLVSQAGKDNKRVDSIVRAKIKPPLDEKLFLNL